MSFTTTALGPFLPPPCLSRLNLFRLLSCPSYTHTGPSSSPTPHVASSTQRRFGRCRPRPPGNVCGTLSLALPMPFWHDPVHATPRGSHSACGCFRRASMPTTWRSSLCSTKTYASGATQRSGVFASLAQPARHQDRCADGVSRPASHHGAPWCRAPAAAVSGPRPGHTLLCSSIHCPFAETRSQWISIISCVSIDRSILPTASPSLRQEVM